MISTLAKRMLTPMTITMPIPCDKDQAVTDADSDADDTVDAD